NGITDEQSSNNSSSVEMNFDEGLSGVQVQILTDFFPEETSWRLIEIPGRTIATGGDYDSPSTLYIESFCLNPDRCYIFTIFDSFGDGICCGENGNGNYQIINEDGSILAESNGRFDASQSKQICPKIACTLSAAITVSDSDDNNNGSIIIEANGSSESYQYSIDGGETFQSSSTFENLAPGDYTVVVVEGSNSDCTYEEVVTVNLITSLQSFEADGFRLLLSPNPNDGYFNIQIEDDSKALQLAFDILDANGRIIQRRTLSRYDGIFNGRISLLAHPKGVYYIRLKGKYEGRLFKVLVL
ncbi:MAG: T9SS type A sorting domain-containing protein, partial [Bacteroidota bacterium]